MKKVLRYFIILLLLLAGLAVIGLLYLFFVPNSSIFGITYIGGQSEVTSQAYEMGQVTGVVINSNGYDIHVVNGTSEDTVSMKVHNNAFGYVLKRNSEPKIDTKLYQGTLTFTVSETTGFAYKNGSYIELRLPNNAESAGIDLTINNSSGTTTIASANTVIDELDFSTSSGSLVLNSGKINGDMTLKMGAGSCTISKAMGLNSNNVTLSQSSGNFQTESEVVLGNFTHLSNTTGNVAVAVCSSYTASLGTAGGHIEIGQVNGLVEIYSSDTHVLIHRQTDGSVNINLTSSGSVTINSLEGSTNGTVAVTTHNGDISVASAQKYLRLDSDSGNIQVTNMFKTVNASTESGNISIAFSEDADSYLTSSQSANRCAIINTVSGDISVLGVDNITLNITGDASANIVMNEVLGENIINATTGGVVVTTPTNLDLPNEQLHKYYLETITQGGSVYIAISGYDPFSGSQWSDAVGYTDPKPSKDQCDHTLSISLISGSIQVINTEVI